MTRFCFFSLVLLCSYAAKAHTTIMADSLKPEFTNAYFAETPDSQFVSSLDSIIDEYDKMQKVFIAVQGYEKQLLKKEMSFDFSSSMTLIKGGLLTWTNEKYRNRNALFKHHKSNNIDYLPAVLPLMTTWTLKIAGIESRSKTKRMVVSNAVALGLGLGAAKIMKLSLDETRPDAHNNHSMPSGHATLAFISATILDREYGHYSPWISVGGYAAALATQFHRIHQNAHYLNDVVIGAGVGVVSTNLAYSITDLILGEKEINLPFVTKGDVSCFNKYLTKPTSFSLYSNSETGYNFINPKCYSLLEFVDHDVHVRSTSSLGTAIELSYFLNNHWALESMARLTQTKIQVVDHSANQPTIYGNNLYQYHVDLGMKYCFMIGLEQRVGIRSFVGYRYVPETKFNAVNTDDIALILNKDSNCEFGGGINVDLLSSKKYISGVSCDYVHSFSSLITNRWVLGSYFKIIL